MPVKIGIIAYLEGELRETEGIPTLNAATLALADFEQHGGVIIEGVFRPVELVVETIVQTQEASVAAARKLINKENVVAIVGPQYSSDAIPAGGLAEQAGVPMICPMSTSPKTTAGRQFVFRMSFLDAAQGAAMAATAQEELGARRAAVLFNQADDYSRGIATVFRARFAERGEVVAFESYLTGETDFRGQMLRIKSAAPDVLYLPVFHNQAVVMAELAKELGVRALLLGADGWDQRQIPLLPSFDNSYTSMHWSSKLPGRETARFHAAYVDKFKAEPNGTAALTYDAVTLILLAMQQQQQSTPAAIREGLMQIEPHPGVGGLIDFVDSGDPQKPVLIMHTQDGASRFYKTVAF